MIKQQKKLQPGSVNLSIIKFNDKVDKIRSASLSTIGSFNNWDYTPSGSTALYDAIGQTIGKFMDDINVIMIITTDGQENSSKEFTREQIVRLINKQRNTKNWNFIYLSEDPTTMHQGESLGINNRTFGCSNTVVGQKQSGKAIGSCTLQNYIYDVSNNNTKKNYNAYTTATHSSYIPIKQHSPTPRPSKWTDFFSNVSDWTTF